MKKIVTMMVLVIMLVFDTTIAEIDLSGMTFNELVDLKERINLAMWECEEWQEITLPQGIYEIGVDIPEGHWTILPEDGSIAYIIIGSFRTGATVDGNKSSVMVASKKYEYYNEDYMEQADVILEKGRFVEVSADAGKAVFVPYSGKPDMGFK